VLKLHLFLLFPQTGMYLENTIPLVTMGETLGEYSVCTCHFVSPVLRSIAYNELFFNPCSMMLCGAILYSLIPSVKKFSPLLMAVI
jgi:hypothetical protein